MAYAVDVIVFLNKPNELQALLRILSVYGQASNARLNRDKTLAVSLSGELHPEWRRMLEANQIFQWHDKQNISAAIYLGYPLTSNKQQLKNYLLSIIVKVEQHTNILSQRNLSIQGRSMVANTLLLSRIWHSIRVISPPLEFFGKIRTLLIRFLKHKNFPFVKFKDCQRARNEGGISILDPNKQHTALQLQWLIPMLNVPQTTCNTDSFATDMMNYYICRLTASPSPILPLLFEEKRNADLRKIGCFRSLFRALDHMDYEINLTELNTSTIEELPLNKICPILSNETLNHSISFWSSMLVKDVYSFDVTEGKLSPRESFRSRSHQKKSKNI